MPECRRCRRTLPSCEVRRTSLGHLCKDNGKGSRCWTIWRELRAAARRGRRRETVQTTGGAEASVG